MVVPVPATSYDTAVRGVLRMVSGAHARPRPSRAYVDTGTGCERPARREKEGGLAAIAILLGLTLALAAFVVLSILLGGWLAAVLAVVVFVAFLGATRTRTT